MKETETTISVEEGNKIIALFMGETEDDYPQELPEWVEVFGNNIDYKYHSSWDWQIPVWRKLRRAMVGHKKFGFKNDVKYTEQVSLFNDNYHAAIDVDSPMSGFEIILLTLKWYNQQNKQA